jgi:hypothetical protein
MLTDIEGSHIDHLIRLVQHLGSRILFLQVSLLFLG